MSDPNGEDGSVASIPPAAASWVGSSLGAGSRILRASALPAASHENHRIAVRTVGGAALDLLLRRFTDRERLRSDPWYEPLDEILALRALEETNLPVPRLLAADVEGTETGVPSLLVTWLPGAPAPPPAELEGFVRPLAAMLPVVHAAPREGVRRSYASYFASDGIPIARLRPPPWSTHPRVWERAFAALDTPPSGSPETFIHRDYHHGNVLWQDGRLTGIVDWTTGCVGPPGIDVAHERLNLVWDVGQEAADAFLRAARAEGVSAHHPYWDLLDAVDGLSWPDPDLPADDDEAAMDVRHEAFLARALAELA